MIGAMVSAILALAGILFYFREHYRFTAIIAVLNVVVLFVLRFTLL